MYFLIPQMNEDEGLIHCYKVERIKKNLGGEQREINKRFERFSGDERWEINTKMLMIE